MIKPVRLVLIICLWVCLQTNPAFACRYNVRETGFVDLGIESYYLYGYISKDTPADITSSFREISYAALLDSNIKAEIIDTDEQKDHPAMKFLDLWSIQSFPSAVLVSPDGQSLVVPVTEPNRPFKETLWSALDDILSSPKREEILQQVAKTYGVVLLIEGTDTQENKRAKEAASAAIEQISSQIELMPKPIAHPPVLIVIDSKSASREKVLLWSLGLDADPPTAGLSKTYAAVLYGRARWIGPLFKDEEITEYNLASVLFVIGADCECGFDYSWLQGTMLPARWNENLQAQAAKSLGFDPENPMIKMEISSIIGRGMGASSYPGVPFGYQELIVESESFNDDRQISPNDVENTQTPKSNAVDSILESYPLAKGYSSFRNTIFILIGLCALILVSGITILVRAKKR